MKERIITACIAAIIFLPITFMGGVPFIVMIYLMASVALFELLRMKKIPILSIPGILSLLLLWLFMLPSEYMGTLEILGDNEKIAIFLFGILLFLIYSVFSNNSFSYEDIGFSILSVLYIGTGFFYIIQTRAEGVLFIFFALLLIWATDSGAYFIGRAIGKRKLAPHISPNKTIEGSIGGILSAILVAIIFYIFTDIGQVVPLSKLLVLSVLLSIFGQFGDLVESALKRHYDVKDSGTLLPGHGGILDRTDSWLFVMPLLYFLLFL